MGEKKFWIITGAIAAFAILVYFLFFNEKPKEKASSGSQIGSGGGGTFNFTNGGTINISNTQTQVNKQNININQGSEGQNINKLNQTRVSRSTLVSSSQFVNIDENQTNILIKKQGETLSFAATSPEAARSMEPLEIPGYSSGNYMPSRRIKQGFKETACIAIINELAKKEVIVMGLTQENQYIYILNILRYIQGFGGLNYNKQKEIIEGILADFANSKPLNSKAICDSILNPNETINPIYAQCLAIIESIIIDKITNPAEIAKRLNKISGFNLIKPEKQQEIIDMVVKGMLNGTLSKEEICSLITSLIIDEIEGTAIYQACLAVMTELSALPTLNYTIVNSYLMKIPGFSALSQKTKDEIIKNILADPKEGGKLDAEAHCTTITLAILGLIEGSITYQACLRVMEKIIKNNITNEKEIKTLLYEIPGFNVLSDAIQKQILEAVTYASVNGTLEAEKVELCRNITALILDAINGNELFKQCYRIIEGIVKSGKHKDEAHVLKELMKIPNFNLLADADKQMFVKKVTEIDLEGDVHMQITNICILMTSMITDLLIGSLVFQQCIKILEEIIEESIYNEDEIREKLKKIPGFILMPKELQERFVKEVATAMKDGNLNEKKKEICLAITSIIEELIGGNITYQQCIKIVEGIFKDGKNKDRDYILSELKKITAFNSFSPAIQTKYVEKILEIEEPDIAGKIKELCINMTIDENNLQTLIQCVKTIVGIVNEKKQTDKVYVRIKMTDIKEFKVLTEIKKDETVNKISLLPNYATEDEYKNTLQSAVSICNEVLKPTPEKPIDPTDPTDPNKPNPEKPIDPTDPNKPNPGKPDPVKPTDPNKPGEETLYPNKPTKPSEAITNNENTVGGESNITTFGSKNYGKCAVLNNLVFNAYNDYLIETTIHNLPVTADAKIEEINNKQPDGEYYISDFYTKAIEQGLIQDFNQILYDTDPSTSRYNSVAKVLYTKFNDKGSAVTELLSTHAKATFISRLYKDKDFLIGKFDDTLISDYIVEIGKCTNPKKDNDFWRKAALGMQNAMTGVQESIYNFAENRGEEGPIQKSTIYSKCQGDIKALPSSASGTMVMAKLMELDGFKNLSQTLKGKFVGDVANLKASCREKCETATEALCKTITGKLLVEKAERRSTPILSKISKCYDKNIDVLPENAPYKHYAELSNESQRIIASKAWYLMLNFNLSAKEKRGDIIKAIWNATEVSWNEGKRKPVPPAVCEQAANDAWSGYNEDSLKKVLEGPLDELLSALEGILESFESGEAMRDFTTPPSQKCKCYMEKIYGKISNATIPNYEACRSAQDTTKNMAFIKSNTTKYINAKLALWQAQENLGYQKEGKDLCMIMFQNIEDMVDDIHEANKFIKNPQENAVTLNQICVQQMRSIYSTITTFKKEYFRPGEIETYTSASSCEIFKDN